MAVDFRISEDLRVLFNLLTVDKVLAAHYLKNLDSSIAQRLLKEVNDRELDQLYEFLARS